MTATPDTGNHAEPLWRFVPTADFRPPAAPVTQSVRSHLASLRKLFQPGDAAKEAPLKTRDDIQAPPRWLLDCVVPAADWQAAASALDGELEPWLAQDSPDPPVVILVGPPYGGHADLLGTWARKRGWPVLQPPTEKQILSADDAWLTGHAKTDGPWVFPGLERAYVRHPEGLSLIRRFLAWSYAGSGRHGVIGCDSWAWAYLRHVWHGRLPTTLTLQAFDAARLAGFFQCPADAANGRSFHFRQSDNGRDVLPPPDGNPAEASNFLQRLAAHSRGNPGVARAIWRTSLRTETDAQSPEVADETVCGMGRQTVWVLPWDQLVLPDLPPGAGRYEAFILHTLLLHDGLPPVLLQQCLPMASDRIMDTFSRLEECGLVAGDEKAWRVAPRGYPAVRRFLYGEGYLTDQL